MAVQGCAFPEHSPEMTHRYILYIPLMVTPDIYGNLQINLDYQMRSDLQDQDPSETYK